MQGRYKVPYNQVGKRNGCENAAATAARDETWCTRINGCAHEPVAHPGVLRVHEWSRL